MHFYLKIFLLPSLFLQVIQSGTQNDRANQITIIEQAVSSQISEAIELINVLLKPDSPLAEQNVENVSPAAYSPQSLVRASVENAKNFNAKINPLRHSTRAGLRHGTAATREKNETMTRSSATTGTNTEPHQHHHHRDVSETREVLLSLRTRLDNIGKMPKAQSAEMPATAHQPSAETRQLKAKGRKRGGGGGNEIKNANLTPLNQIVADKRQIDKDKALDKWKSLMEVLVLNIGKLSFYADQNRSFDANERQMLDESLAFTKSANDRPLKEFGEIGKLLANAMHAFTAYQTQRKQSAKKTEKDDNLERNEDKQNDNAVAPAGTRDNDDMDRDDASTVPNDSGSKTSIIDGSPPSPLAKAYSEGELMALRRHELGRHFAENNWRRANSVSPEKSSAENETDDEDDDDYSEEDDDNEDDELMKN